MNNIYCYSMLLYYIVVTQKPQKQTTAPRGVAICTCCNLFLQVLISPMYKTAQQHLLIHVHHGL